jgi:hypothetical protein
VQCAVDCAVEDENRGGRAETASDTQSVNLTKKQEKGRDGELSLPIESP